MAIWDSMGNFNAGVQLGSAMDTANFDSGGGIGGLASSIIDAYGPAAGNLTKKAGSQMFDTFEDDLDSGVGQPGSYIMPSDTAKEPPTEIAEPDTGLLGGLFGGDGSIYQALPGIINAAADAVAISKGKNLDQSGSKLGAYMKGLKDTERFDRLIKTLGKDSTTMKDKDGKMKKSIQDYALRNAFDLEESIFGGLNENLLATFPGTIFPGITFRA